MERELQWWKGQLASDIHQSLRIKELKLPVYRANSPQIGMRRYFADLLAILSNRYQLCPTARHLAVYLLDLFMDHYDVAVKQLYIIALSCLLLAKKQSGLSPRSNSFAYCSCLFHIDDIINVCLSARTNSPSPSPVGDVTTGKFEEKEDRVPKLEQLNSLGFMCSLNLVLDKRDLIKMELLLLETFGWNLCMPTPAHFIDYYLHAAVQEGDLYNGWPLSSMSKTKAFMDKYTHYFLEVSLQDHAFLNFRPSQVAAACVAASRVCLQISPSWTTSLHLLTGYSWEHLTPCIELMLLIIVNVLLIVTAADFPPLTGICHPETTPQLLFQPDSFTHLSQHSPSLSQLQALADSQALGPVDFLQSHRMGLLTGAPSITAGGAFPSYPGLTSGLQPGARALPLQSPISVQMALTGEPRHCLSMAYSGGYLGTHHTFTAGCFDR
uniref:Cyclin-J-like protein n=1 Tax=Poecilia formosa TaxID=48698 RepID=A0A087XT67_POEFO